MQIFWIFKIISALGRNNEKKGLIAKFHCKLGTIKIAVLTLKHKFFLKFSFVLIIWFRI